MNLPNKLKSFQRLKTSEDKTAPNRYLKGTELGGPNYISDKNLAQFIITLVIHHSLTVKEMDRNDRKNLVF
jgi:hypothetical protein